MCLTPCTRLVDAEVSGTAVPARFSAYYVHAPLCTLKCLMRRRPVRLRPLASLHLSLRSSGTRRCARERFCGGVRYSCARSLLTDSLCQVRAHAVVYGSDFAEVSGTAVLACFSPNRYTRHGKLAEQKRTAHGTALHQHGAEAAT